MSEVRKSLNAGNRGTQSSLLCLISHSMLLEDPEGIMIERFCSHLVYVPCPIRVHKISFDKFGA